MNLRKSIFILIFVLACSLFFTSCSDNTDNEALSNTQISQTQEQSLPHSTKEETEKMLSMKINGEAVSVEWENNDSVKEIKKLCSVNPLIINMRMYGGFEQVGSIGAEISRNDKQITTSPGDIMLYSGNQLVVFYGSNSWSYTRLGKIADKNNSELEKLLSAGDVSITISLEG